MSFSRSSASSFRFICALFSFLAARTASDSCVNATNSSYSLTTSSGEAFTSLLVAFCLTKSTLSRTNLKSMWAR